MQLFYDVNNIFQQRIEVNDMIWQRRIAKYHDHQFLRGDDEYPLPIMAFAIVHILWNIGKFLAFVEPEKSTVTAFAVRGRRNRVIYPPFWKDS